MISIFPIEKKNQKSSKNDFQKISNEIIAFIVQLKRFGRQKTRFPFTFYQLRQSFTD